MLALDYSGAGGSEDPFRLGAVEALDRRKDVRAALSWLGAPEGGGRESFVLIAHSGGSSPALEVGIADPEVEGIVLIGPPRRSAERLGDPEDREYFWRRAQRTHERLYGAPFPSWYTRELRLELARKRNIENFIPYFSGANHKPLLLIDGELESIEDRMYLRDYYSRLSDPVRYVTIEGSDHYLNTLGVRGRALYDADVVATAVDLIDEWILTLSSER